MIPGAPANRNGFAAFLKNGQRLTTATTMTLESDWQFGMRVIAARADHRFSRVALIPKLGTALIQNEP